MKIIAIMNNKGGVGKTVTAINLADILVRDYHKRVVLADCDGQLNLTRFFFPEFDPKNGGTVAEILTGECEPYWRESVTEVFEGLDLLPGSPALYDLDLLAIRDGLGDPHALMRFCKAAAEDGETDYFIFDCPLGYTLASVSALIAADEVVVPMLVDGFSFAGMMDMQDQRSRVRAKLRSVGVTTVETVRSVAESFFPGGVRVVEEADKFRVEIRLSWKGEAPADPKQLAAALREIMPAHLSWGFRVSMEAEAPLYLGGWLACQTTLPVLEGADEMKWLDKLRVGGTAAMLSVLPVPELT